MSKKSGSGATGAHRVRLLESVVGTLLRHGTMSRTELAELTGYSQSSMTSSIRRLIRLGHVIETGQGRSTGGRRRTLLEFNRRSVLLTLLSLDGKHLVARQVDLAGTVHVQVRRHLDLEHPLTSVTRAVKALQGVAEQPSACAVISLPGVVSAEGDVSLAPALGRPTAQRLQDVVAEVSGLHTIGENDVNLLALGEAEGGAARGGDDFCLIYVGDGIGGALVLDGKVRRGVTGSAGEIGFLPGDALRSTATAPHAPESGVGALEAAWSVPALEKKAEEIGIEPGDLHVLRALEASDLQEAKSLLDDALSAWAYAAVVLACVVNPGRILFAGDADQLSPAAREALSARVQAGSPSPVDVRFAEMGERAIAAGAITNVRNAPWLFLPDDVENGGTVTLPPGPGASNHEEPGDQRAASAVAAPEAQDPPRAAPTETPSRSTELTGITQRRE